ncbi:hypothetical protein [Metabacillus fastidiosus]
MELEGMKTETEKKINELRTKTANQLRIYQSEWRTAMINVKGSVKNEMAEMPSIGEYAISGLIAGLLSRKAELIAVAAELASIVSGTFQEELDIHSPSRVFKGFGININEGLIQGIQESSKQLNRVMRNVYGSMTNSTQKMIQANNNINSNNVPVPNHTTIENNYNMQFYSPKALDPYETARQNRNALRELSLQV